MEKQALAYNTDISRSFLPLKYTCRPITLNATSSNKQKITHKNRLQETAEDTNASIYHFNALE